MAVLNVTGTNIAEFQKTATFLARSEHFEEEKIPT